MRAFYNTLKKSVSGPVGFLIVAVFLFWLKTYAGYIVEFNLGISNSMQEFLLLFNPISTAVIFFGIALFAKGRKSFIWMIIINLLLSIVQYANIVYYRFFNDFITWPTLTQTSNISLDGGMLGSIAELLRIYDPLYFADTIILIL